jgi:peptidoglycan/LPS O-acetylase OafA/YrhL
VVMIISFSSLDGKNRFNVVSMVGMRFLFNVMSFWILGRAVIFGYKNYFGKILEWRPVVYLGRISYGIYLYHLFIPPFVRIVLNHFKVQANFESDHLWIFVLIYISITVIIASASWFLLEKPLNQLKKYFNYNKKSKSIVDKI